MARVAVIGVGAIGGAVAGLLQLAGRHEITLCTRRPLKTLTVKTPEGNVSVQARNILDPNEAQPVDWILVATKAYDAASAATWFSALSKGCPPVAIFQNGVEHRERFAPYLPFEQIVPVIIDCSVEKQEVGHVVQRSNAQMKV